MPYGGKTEIQYVKRADGTLVEVGRTASGFWAWALDRNRNRSREVVIPATVKTMDQARVYVESRTANPHRSQAWIKHEGTLGEGFLTSMSQRDRHAALNQAVTRYGYKSAMGKVQALQRSTKLRRLYGSKLKDSIEYLQRKYRNGARQPSRSRHNPGATIGDAVGGDAIADLKRRLLR